MPIYEYRCTVCGHLTEVLQKISDPPLAACPECGEPVTRLLSAPAFQFKGSGWYATDYAGKGKKEGGSKGDEGSKPAAEAKDTGPKSAPSSSD